MKLRKLLKLGLYVGSFKPMHIGHLDIARRAGLIFDKVIIAQGVNSTKSDECDLPFISGFETCNYSSLTTNLVAKFKGRYDVTLVRGIRGGYDLDYETNQQRAWQDIMPDLQIVMIRGDAKYDHISSTMIRELQKFDPVAAAKYIV